MAARARSHRQSPTEKFYMHVTHVNFHGHNLKYATSKHYVVLVRNVFLKSKIKHRKYGLVSPFNQKCTDEFSYMHSVNVILKIETQQKIFRGGHMAPNRHGGNLNSDMKLLHAKIPRWWQCPVACGPGQSAFFAMYMVIKHRI